MFDRDYVKKLPKEKKFDLTEVGYPGYILTHCRKVWSCGRNRFLNTNASNRVQLKKYGNERVTINLLHLWRQRWSEHHINRVAFEDQVDLTYLGYPGYIITRDKNIWHDRNCSYKKISKTGRVTLYREDGSRYTENIRGLWNHAFGECIDDLPESDRKCLDFLGYSKYWVTRCGRVWSTRLRDWMETNLNHNGYPQLILCNSSKQKSYRIHRLVALAFHPNPENKPEVNHLDGVKTNNNDWNLEWATKSENIKHAYDTGLIIHRDWKQS